MRAGVPPFILAERHIMFLNPVGNDVKGIASLLQLAQQAHIPQFNHMAQEPAFNEVAIQVSPVSMNQIRWDNGVGYSCGNGVSEASLDFALTEPRFVYAIRLTYTYPDKADKAAAFRMSWGNGNHNKQVNGGDTGCNGGLSLTLDIRPDDMWTRMYRSGPKKLTAWVNTTIDRFRVCPDIKPFSFGVSEITLLTPQ